MSRFFNTTGPCNPEKHYILPPEARLVRAQLDRYISDELYWVLHAPRQSGKTTFLQSWMRTLNASGQVLACYVSVETGQGIADEEKAIPGLCSAIRSFARDFLGQQYMPPISTEPASMMLSDTLYHWAALVAPRPLVVLFDEVDVLQDQAMISFLRQLRSGFSKRGVGVFPISIVLVGMRDLRPGSPFNIKEDSATLSSFSADDVRSLIGQHMADTGQVFSDEAISRIWELTRGQPWLVNALCKKCVWQLCPKGESVESRHIEEARELLIQERAVHLDSLAERLRDARLKHIVQTIITGESDPTLTDGDDFRLAMDLGLVSMENGSPVISNPIYRETIARVLSQGMQDAIPAPEFRWQKSDGTLDMETLLKEFQRFWRRHADLWEAKADYTEAFPHLLLMAFLQRVVNGGGRIEREYAAGRGRMDLAVLYGGRWSIIEIKLVRLGEGHEATVEEGLVQINRYRALVDPKAASFLLVFDRTPSGRALPWDRRLSWDLRETAGGKVTIVGA